jgi:hypothetical protein
MRIRRHREPEVIMKAPGFEVRRLPHHPVYQFAPVLPGADDDTAGSPVAGTKATPAEWVYAPADGTPLSEQCAAPEPPGVTAAPADQPATGADSVPEVEHLREELRRARAELRHAQGRLETMNELTAVLRQHLSDLRQVR